MYMHNWKHRRSQLIVHLLASSHSAMNALGDTYCGIIEIISHLVYRNVNGNIIRCSTYKLAHARTRWRARIFIISFHFRYRKLEFSSRDNFSNFSIFLISSSSSWSSLSSSRVESFTLQVTRWHGQSTKWQLFTKTYTRPSTIPMSYSRTS